MRRCVDVEEACLYFMTWPQQEGWNFCYDSQEFRQVFYPCDPNGFFLGTVTNQAKQETVVSIILSLRLSADMGWIGCIIVTGAHRGKGYGAKSLHHALDYLKGCRFVGLDSSPMATTFYYHLGFKQSWRCGIFRGDILGNVVERLNHCDYQDVSIMDWTSSTNNTDFAEELVQLDLKLLGYRRPRFWNNLLTLYSGGHSGGDLNATCIGRMAAFVLDGNGNIAHFACSQPLENGFAVALYSDSPHVAKALLLHLSSRIYDSSAGSSPKWCLSKDHEMSIYINACTANPASTKLLQALGFELVTSRERLIYGGDPDSSGDPSTVISVMTPMAG
jgi:GNAT superfamily N-acetyltransferase